MDLFRSTDEIIEKINQLSRIVEDYPDVFIDKEQLEKLEDCWCDLETVIIAFYHRIPKK